MKLRKLICLLLSLVLAVGLLAGCGQSGAADSGASGSTVAGKSQSSADTSASAASSGAESASSSEIDSGERELMGSADATEVNVGLIMGLHLCATASASA